MADFLEFIDNNSQPNGHQAGSYSAQFFFLPKFTRIAPPKAGEKNFNEKANIPSCRIQQSTKRAG